MFEKISAPIEGAYFLKPKVFHDERGLFYELFQDQKLEKMGVRTHFVQDNCSVSKKGVLRGLHFQSPHPQVKLVHCLEGEIWDVAVDIRKGSPTFGKHFSQTLSSQNRLYCYIPEGFAHGFCVQSETATVLYKVSDYYYPEFEKTLLWNDPALSIPWPGTDPLLSAKDRDGMKLEEIPQELLTPYEPKLL